VFLCVSPSPRSWNFDGLSPTVGVPATRVVWLQRRRAGDGTERARVFVELTFDRYGLDTYYATCAATNDRSRRMIEGYVTDYGGRHEGVIRNHSGRPDGGVTDQHRFSITRREYETAVCEAETTFETE